MFLLTCRICNSLTQYLAGDSRTMQRTLFQKALILSFLFVNVMGSRGLAFSQDSSSVMATEQKGVIADSCSPPCRSGKYCDKGTCITLCNPPCPEGSECGDKGKCIALPRASMISELEPTREDVPKEKQERYRKRRVFYFSINLGGCYGVYSGKFSVVGNENAVVASGIGPALTIRIGGSVVENLTFFAEMELHSSVATRVKVNDEEKSEADTGTSLSQHTFGVGVMYREPRNNLFVALSGGMNTADVTQASGSKKDTYKSATGFGASLSLGKDWWLGRHFSLGLGITYHFSVQGDGEFFPTNTLLYTNSVILALGLSFN